MLVYTPKITSRITYIFRYIGEVTGCSFELTESVSRYKSIGLPRINYSAEPIDPNEYQIIPCGLLQEQGVRPVEIRMNRSGPVPFFFETAGTFPFDLPAAIFYLISRYEEYLPFQPDLYGRFPHEAALATKENFLDIPLVDVWMNHWSAHIQSFFPSVHINPCSSRVLATYDIDMAWSYLHKGWVRNLGGALKDPARLPERIRVLSGKEKDPFDCYETLYDMHRGKESETLFFFLVPKQRSHLDKNIDPDHPALQQLIRTTHKRSRIGLHPSVYSHTHTAALSAEKNTLEKIIGDRITHSRQHYLKFILPQTYRTLLASGMTDDYSMGYGTINGFRASTARPFFWYDLEKETATALRIHAPAWMDANAFYENRCTSQEAMQELEILYNRVKQSGGDFITISHNHLLGEKSQWVGWPDQYRNWYHKMNQELYI